MIRLRRRVVGSMITLGSGVAAIALLVPNLGPFRLLLLVRGSSACLRERGLSVGLLGVREPEIDRWIAAGFPRHLSEHAMPPRL